MDTKPRVGVTGNAKRWSPSWWCTRLALRLSGAKGVRISIRQPRLDETFDALIIGGGDDISAEHYQGDINLDVKIDKKRDHLELQWINLAFEKKTPLLGICRGAQLINVALGGNLHQDIKPMRFHTRNRRGLLPTKKVKLSKNSILSRCTAKSSLRVNSLHNQAIFKPGNDLIVTARDRDNIVQAIEHETQPILLGVQWHPEYLFYLPSQLALFRWLIDKARNTLSS